MEITTPERAFFKINAFNPHVPYSPELEDAVLTFEHAGLISGKVETARHSIVFAYFEDPDDPNGLINMTEKVVDRADNLLAGQSRVPREVIITLVSIVSGTDYCQQYRLGGPFFVDPVNNNVNNNNGNNNNGNNNVISILGNNNNHWNNDRSTLSNNEPRSIHGNNLNGGRQTQRRKQHKRKTRKARRT